jgi:hypothetical protein
MFKAIRLSSIGLLAIALTGCTTIRYAVNTDDAGPVTFAASKGGAESRAVKQESRSYFGGLGLVTYNDFVTALGNPMNDLAQKSAHSKRKLSTVAIVEEYSPIDIGLGLVVNSVGSLVTGGLAGVVFSGSRTSTIVARSEEKAR